MADRARLAKVPQPDTALKCPRCESTNTKFCYFNNYSLTQPRHFCKTCRRYWTRGGALRNVPVGGGCRRNKRSKGGRSRSKSPVSTADRQAADSSSALQSNSCSSSDMLPHFPTPQHQQQHLPFLPPNLHHFSDHYGVGDIGLNFGGFQMNNSNSSSGGGGTIGDQQWRMQAQVQQFPFLAGLEPQAGLFQFDQGGVESSGYIGGTGQLRDKSPLDSGAGGAVKAEDDRGLNLSRNFLGGLGNDQFWGAVGNAWTDLSGFTSTSSTSHV